MSDIDPKVKAEAAAIHAATGDGTVLDLVPEPAYRKLLAIAEFTLARRVRAVAEARSA